MKIRELIAYDILKLKRPEETHDLMVKKDQEIKQLYAWLFDKEKLIKKLETENEDIKNKIAKMETSITTTIQKEKTYRKDLSIDENKVLDQVLDKKMVPTKEIQGALACSRSKTWKVINKMKEKGVIALGGTPKKPFLYLPKDTEYWTQKESKN